MRMGWQGQWLAPTFILAAALAGAPQTAQPQADPGAAGATRRAPARPSQAHALEIAPVVGVLLPLSLLVDGRVAEGPVRARQIGAPLIGVRAGYRIARALTAELGTGYAPASVAITRPGSTTDHSGGVLLSTARTLLRLPGWDEAPRWGFRLGAGVAWHHRHGRAWSGRRGASQPALVAGVGGKPPRAGRIDVVLEANAVASRVQIDHHRPRMHWELLWTVGAILPLGRSPAEGRAATRPAP